MNPGLKQRLVGAVVLIALAVIILPMLLPGSGGSTMPMFGSNVPDAPGKHFEPIEIPLQVPPPAPQTEVAVVDQPQPGDVASNEKPQQPPVAAPAPTLTPAAVPAPVQPPASVPSPPQQASAPKPASQQAAAVKPATPAAAPHAPAEAWAVQLGSFSSSVNALTLQEKARKAGFRAYVEKVKSEQGSSYRVRVGPESSRERADALRARVQEKLKMSGMVVPHKS